MVHNVRNNTQYIRTMITPIFLLVFSFRIRFVICKRRWNSDHLFPISQLSLIKDKEFAFDSLEMPIARRTDGSLFVFAVLIDNPLWIGLALNSLVSISKFVDLRAITVMTIGSEPIDTIFKRLGLYTYNASSSTDKFPQDFRPAKQLTWSWGEIIFLRYNLMIEAFRRKLGLCVFDLDTTFNDDIFGKNEDGKFFDIVTQGDRLPTNKNLSGNECK